MSSRLYLALSLALCCVGCTAAGVSRGGSMWVVSNSSTGMTTESVSRGSGSILPALSGQAQASLRTDSRPTERPGTIAVTREGITITGDVDAHTGSFVLGHFAVSGIRNIGILWKAVPDMFEAIESVRNHEPPPVAPPE